MNIENNSSQHLRSRFRGRSAIHVHKIRAPVTVIRPVAIVNFLVADLTISFIIAEPEIRNRVDEMERVMVMRRWHNGISKSTLVVNPELTLCAHIRRVSRFAATSITLHLGLSIHQYKLMLVAFVMKRPLIRSTSHAHIKITFVTCISISHGTRTDITGANYLYKSLWST